MTPPTADRDYWEDRARRHGPRAAGYSDTAMDAYEDRLRQSAIERLLGPGRGRSLLDAGSGSGRWSVRMADNGWLVTGADISESLIALAPPAPNVTYLHGAIEALDLPAATFDAVLSVTVLQHITDDRHFDAALDNLARMLHPNGLIAVLEYAPLRVIGHVPAYMRARSRGEWISAFTSRGFKKRSETGIRFLGHGPYMLAVHLARLLGHPDAQLITLRAVCRALDLTLARVPGLTLVADVRLITFEKVQR